MGKKAIDFNEHRNIKLFNRPIEFGLRSLFILNEIFPHSCDLQRLIYYDYLILHSKDVDGGGESIHPEYPHRSAEILVKRQMMRDGLLLMRSKELIDINFTKKGIFYCANELTGAFINLLTTDYAQALKEVSFWIAGKFGEYSDQELENFIDENIENWGSEFTREAFIRGHDLE